MGRLAAALFVASAFGAATPAGAQGPPTAFQYPPPPGWVRTPEGQITTFRPPTEPPDSVVLWVMPPMARQADFAAQVEGLRAAVASAAGLSEMRDVEARRTGAAGGREQRTHLATYSSAGGDLHLSVEARAEGASVGTVVFMATSAEAWERLRPVAVAVFEGMRLPGAAAAPAAAPVAAAAAGPAPTAGFRGPGLSGVWMGSVRASLSTDSFSGMDWRWRTFFDDGLMFADLPEEGLLGFDRAASQASEGRAGYWQTYTFSGTSGEARRAGTPYPWSLRSSNRNVLQIDGDTYYRCASVDGLRLQGAWTSYSNPNDPDLDQLPFGRRAVIRFSRDGRFVDEGLFAMFMRSYTGGDDSPGEGRYEMRDFTVVLRYDDGRVRREALTGFLGTDPSKVDDQIFFRRTPLKKRPGK